VSTGSLDASKPHKYLIPSALARTLKPPSAVVTARIFPSLLNLKQGRL